MAALRAEASAHALVRWIERVEGVDMEPFRKAAERTRRMGSTDPVLLDLLSASGYDIEEARERLLSPLVHAAVNLGCKSVSVRDHTLILDGVVVTSVVPGRRVSGFPGERDRVRPLSGARRFSDRDALRRARRRLEKFEHRWEADDAVED